MDKKFIKATEEYCTIEKHVAAPYMRSTIREKLLDKQSCTLKGRTQTAQAMGLYHGIFEKDEE